jgi:hypothetical protein
MDPSRPNRILRDWTALANSARRPAVPPRRVVVRSGLAGPTFAGAGLVAVAIVVAVVWLGGRGPNGTVGGLPTATPTTAAVATGTATPAPTPVVPPATPVTPVATPRPTARPTPVTVVACTPSRVAARITLWEGAAGHRIAHVELKNVGADPCKVPSLERPQLLDGHGAVLINGASPAASTLLTVAPGATLKTLVQDGNYCGAAPAAPVTVAFVLPSGQKIVAAPVSPTDATVPPCNGAGSPADIQMQPWTH